MADKEERILILSTKGECSAILQEGCHIADSCSLCNVGITRQEAIEVMAKAICREDNCLDSCAECILGFGSTAEEKEQFCQKQIIMSRDLSASYVSRAEVALNALLEGVKK